MTARGMTATGGLRGRRVALGVTGGIAPYKPRECVRLLTRPGAEVRVVLLPACAHLRAPPAV